MRNVSKRRKCPNCLGRGICTDGSTCPTCNGAGDVAYQREVALPETPCWEPNPA